MKKKPQINQVDYGDKIGKYGHYKYIYRTCEKCGKKRWIKYDYYLKGKSKRCPSCCKVGKLSNVWKGGRHKRGDGYVTIKLYPEDKYYPMTQKAGYVMQHRLVMAKHIGRPLTKEEIVHHRNGNKTDNRIENLNLMSSRKFHNTKYGVAYEEGYAAGYKDGLSEILGGKSIFNEGKVA